MSTPVTSVRLVYHQTMHASVPRFSCTCAVKPVMSYKDRHAMKNEVFKPRIRHHNTKNKQCNTIENTIKLTSIINHMYVLLLNEQIYEQIK